MNPRAAALAPLLVLLVTALSGCGAPAAEPVTLLHRNHEQGEDLYTWSVPDFHGTGAGSERRMRATFTVHEGHLDVGVLFRGTLAWANTTAQLELQAPGGGTVLALHAEQGAEDDHGTIAGHFQFRTVVPLRAGTYEIVLFADGHLSQVDLRFVGIEAAPTVREETFDVEDARQRLTLRMHFDGWGATPTVFLRDPSGTTHPFTLDGPVADRVERFTPMTGTYTLVLDTAGWAGRATIRAEQGRD
jgi:hypothetical protein